MMPTTSLPASLVAWAVLQELGYVEGTHFVIEYRSADGLDERFPELAADSVRVRWT